MDNQREANTLLLLAAIGGTIMLVIIIALSIGYNQLREPLPLRMVGDIPIAYPYNGRTIAPSNNQEIEPGKDEVYNGKYHLVVVLESSHAKPNQVSFNNKVYQVYHNFVPPNQPSKSQENWDCVQIDGRYIKLDYLAKLTN